MAEPFPDRFIIDYATAEETGEIRYIRQMLWWRSMFGWCFVVMIAATFFSAKLATGAGAAATVTGAMTIFLMGRAAWNEVDGSYAARQVLLAIALTPLFFLGVWIVPALVKSDLIKWRAVEEDAVSGDDDNR